MRALTRHLFNRRNLLIVVGILLISITFNYLGRFDDIADWLRREFGSLVGYNYVLAGVVFVVLAALSAIFTLFTSTPIVPIAAAIWGKGATLVMLFGGWMLGAAVAYYIGYVLSHVLVRFKIFKKISSYREKINNQSGFMLMLLFRLAAPAEVASYTLGLIRYRFGWYLLITAISDFPFAVLAIYSSAALLGPNPMLFAVFMIGGLLTISLFVYLFHLQIKKTHGVSFHEE